MALEKPLRSEWTERLSFKKELSLTEYLKVIERISEDDTKEEISANKEKINRLYERIADSYDFSVGNSNFTLVQNWEELIKFFLKKENSSHQILCIYFPQVYPVLNLTIKSFMLNIWRMKGLHHL